MEPSKRQFIQNFLDIYLGDRPIECLRDLLLKDEENETHLHYLMNASPLNILKKNEKILKFFKDHQSTAPYTLHQQSFEPQINSNNVQIHLDIDREGKYQFIEQIFLQLRQHNGQPKIEFIKFAVIKRALDLT